MPGRPPGRPPHLDDLAKFPFTGKNDLRDNYPYGMFAVPSRHGAPARLQRHHRQADRGRLHPERHRHLGQRGRALDPRRRRAQGDKVHVSYGYGLFTGGLGAHYGAERLGCTVIPMSGGQTEKQVQLIRDFQPDIIMVTPSYMLNLADEIERQGIDPHNLRCAWHLRCRALDRRMRAIEQRLGIDALDIYGLSEIMGPGVPWNASRPRTARPSGKTTSTRDHRPGDRRGCRTASWASWCSPR
jgi:phenylacetate-CoA ligase